MHMSASEVSVVAQVGVVTGLAVEFCVARRLLARQAAAEDISTATDAYVKGTTTNKELLCAFFVLCSVVLAQWSVFTSKGTTSEGAFHAVMLFTFAVSTVFFALFSVQIERLSDRGLSVSHVLAVLGLLAILLLWPVQVLLHFVGLEDFTKLAQLPAAQRRLFAFLVAANASVSLFSNLFYVWGVKYTSAVQGLVGLTMSVPLSVVWDHAVAGPLGVQSEAVEALTWQKITGSVCVVLAVTALTVLRARRRMPRDIELQ
ncbi:MAG: hypothetical protein MHM6MM_006969 [Cercozoa sp. M6MM]